MLLLLLFLGGGRAAAPVSPTDTHDGVGGPIYRDKKRDRQIIKLRQERTLDEAELAATIRAQVIPAAPKPKVKVKLSGAPITFNFDTDDEEALLCLI